MNKLLLSMCLFLTGNIIAQINSFVDLQGNTIECRINSNGDLFSDLINFSSGFEVEDGSNLHTIFSNRIVFGGIGPNGDLILTKPHGSNNFANGPLAVNSGMEYGPATITQAQSNAWSQIWVITRQEITDFYNYNNCLNDPNCDEQTAYPGYQIPAVIMNWPAHGDVSLNEPYNLARFNDVNDDGVYNPLDGDYPCIKGDVYAWFIMNNQLVDTSVNTGQGGIEIHVEVYQYDQGPNNLALRNTVFVGYDVINRSTTLMSDFYFSNYTDVDLGNAEDDYMACLPDQNAYFVYNGDSFDENTSFGLGFGDLLPVQGIVSLNNDLHAFGYADLDAMLPIEYYNVMRGYHNDGSPKVFPGTQVQTNFTFPYSDTVPYHWTESNSDGNGYQNSPGDRRVQGSAGPYILQAGGKIEFDYAFVYSRTHINGSGGEESINNLIADIATIQHFYDNFNPNCSGGYLATEEITTNDVSIYPNPMHTQVTIENPNQEKMEVKLYDLNGKVVLTTAIYATQTLNVEHLPRGMYVIELTSTTLGTVHKKLIKE